MHRAGAVRYRVEEALRADEVGDDSILDRDRCDQGVRRCVRRREMENIRVGAGDGYDKPVLGVFGVDHAGE